MKVRDIIKLIEADGWQYIGTKGDHRQYKHQTKDGRVTVAGHLSDDLHPKTLVSIFRQAKITKPKRLREESMLFISLDLDEQSEGWEN